MPDVLVSISSDGVVVAESDFSDADASEIAETLGLARARGAQTFWAHGGALAEYGFRRESGYARLGCPNAPRGEPLPVESNPEELIRVYRLAYLGLWGHKQVGAEFAAYLGSGAQLRHVVLDGVGVCRVDMQERLVDGPGVVPDHRTPERYLRLLSAACAELGPGPASLVSWGDPPERLASYETLGFEVVERLDGWSLDL